MRSRHQRIPYIMANKLVGILFLLLPAFPSFSQYPNVDFNLQTEACKLENIVISNQSDDGTYEWDFCEGDLVLSPSVTTLTNDEFNIPIGASLIESNGKWYGFITSLNNNSLFRLDFGDSLSNLSPTVTNLGNLGGLINAPQDVEVINFESNYYVFINNRGANKLIRINLGSDIEATFASADVLVTGGGFTNGGFDIVFDGTNWVAAITNRNFLTLINLGNTPTNVPNSSGIINTSVIPETDNIGDINFVQAGEEWYGFIVCFGSKSVHRLAFGENLFKNPVATRLEIPELNSLNPYGLVLEKDNNQWMLFSSTNQGNLIRLKLGNDIINNSPVYDDLGRLGGLQRVLKFDIAKSKSRWFGLATDWNSKKFFLLEFPQADCPFNKEFSLNKDTVLISSSESGSFNISLQVKSANGLISTITKTTEVLETAAPNIVIDNTVCFESSIQLTAQTNQSLTSTTWIINGDTLTDETVTYDFPSPGTYPVTLEVQSENGCGNRLTKEITIYEPPTPGFTAPSGQICTNGAVNFANTTDTKGADSLITYQWLVDGELVSEEENPAITFAEGGSKTVRLEARIPGCTEIIEQTVNVLQGPTVGFAVPQVCEGAPMAFENLTFGEDITGYQWDFGDGGTFSSATAESPTYAFEAAGTYEVALSVSNGAGCLNTYRQEVVVYQQPSVGFLSEVACVGTPTQFTDTTTAGANANIIAWQWDFGDGSTAEVRNPAHVYQQPGTYTVRLTAQSTAGCEASTEQTIIVESPVAADFLVDRTCPTEETPYLVQLTDVSTASEGEEVTQWFWTVEGQTFTTPNVTYAFREPGRYEVSLTAFASSACNATVTKTIRIDTLPTVAFTYENACVGSPLAFESEVSMTSMDMSGVDTSGETISGYTWSFGDVGTALEANPTFVFEEAGTYEVRLTVQTESGCAFTTSQPVTIGKAPVAEFTASATFGGAPLTVNFTHPADASVQYRWDFGGQGTSVEPNPTFTFTELGTYPVTLTATNAVGCVDTFFQTITVVEPAQDVQLTDIEVLDGPNGTQQLVLTLQNAGTLLVPSLSITVDLGNAASLQALVDEPLLPGQTLRYPLNFQLPVPVPNQSNALRYVCASVMLREADFEEPNLDNNRACVSLNQQLSVEAPFPNPATDEVQLSLILPQASPVALRLINAQGKVMRQQTVAETQSGLNTFLIPVRGLPVGSYILQVVYRGEQQRFRVAVGL